MQIKGIDVSKWQANIDFAKVKSAGIEFVILRAGYGRELSQKDEYFDINYKNAKAAGLPVGAYWYSYADSEADAVKEAKTCLEVLKGKQFEYPIYFDLEEKSQFDKGKAFCDSIVKAFCGELEKAGYFAGLYCSTYWLTNFISKEVASRYTLWVAEYGTKCTYSVAPYGIWQYSSKGKVNGISVDVDEDYCYNDFPATIKNGGFNGFAAQQTAPSNPATSNNTYRFDDKTQLSEHFNVSEFRCKCGTEHDTILSSELVSKLENLFSAINCSKIIVNSGYRCAKHDKNVGGTGTGQHTTGNAADIVCYDNKGDKISTKVVTCAAQDLGFNGIGKINDTATHVDVRKGSKWYGDETITSSKSITDDFYKYWNFTKEDVYGKSTKPVKDPAPTTNNDKDVTLVIDGKTYKGSLKEES